MVARRAPRAPRRRGARRTPVGLRTPPPVLPVGTRTGAGRARVAGHPAARPRGQAVAAPVAPAPDTGVLVPAGQAPTRGRRDAVAAAWAAGRVGTATVGRRGPERGGGVGSTGVGRPVPERVALATIRLTTVGDATTEVV